MKIWLLTSEFPPLYGGGISTYCLESAKMFSSQNYEVTIITQDYNVNGINEIKESGYRVIRFNPNKYFTSSFLGYEAHLSYAFAETVKELLQKEGAPDIIESQEYMGIAYYLLQYKWLKYEEFKNLKIVITLHAPSFLYLEYNKVPLYKLPYFWVGEMERFCIRAADMVISPSNYLIEELKSRMMLDDINIHVIKNPYNVNWELPKNKVVKNKIVFFGKLIPQKGCLEVIDYFRQLWKDGFTDPLLMIGGGDHLYHPEGVDMIEFIRQKYKPEIESEQLKLLGSIRPEKIDEHLSNAHIVIIPSLVDNLPYTVLEAMGRGKMVLASMQGGQSEVIKNNSTGFLFDHTIPESFKARLNEALSLTDDELKSLTEKAYSEIKETYSYSSIFAQKDILLRDLIKEKKDKKVFPFIRPLKCNGKLNLIISSDEQPLLSIVIPYFNMGDYIQDTVDSIFVSGYKNIEIIIVNDGSTENKSIEKLNTYKNNKIIKVLHKKNEGLALARNFGAKHTNGKLLAFLDPDDTVEKDYYDKAINVLLNYENVYFVGCWAKYFGEAKGYWPSFNPEPPYLLFHNMINSSALVYKKEAFTISGLNDPAMIYGMEDYESVINMVKNGYQGVVLPEPLWNYRIRKNSMARAFTTEKQVYLYSLITNKHADFYSNFAADITKLLNANGPGMKYDNPTLVYDIPYNRLMSSSFKQFLINKAKSYPIIRKVAIKLKRIYTKHNA